MTTRVVRCGGIVLSSWRGYRYHYLCGHLLLIILFFYSVLPWGRKFSSFYLPTDYLSRNRSVDINISVMDDIFQYLSNIITHTKFVLTCLHLCCVKSMFYSICFLFLQWYLSRRMLKNGTMVPLSTSDFFNKYWTHLIQIERATNKRRITPKGYKMTKIIFELLFMCWLRWNNTAINALTKAQH